jgi:hypothetical protein
MTSSKPGSQSGLKADDLIRSESVKLTEEELGSVSGGQLAKIGDLKGESVDDKSKDWNAVLGWKLS